MNKDISQINKSKIEEIFFEQINYHVDLKDVFFYELFNTNKVEYFFSDFQIKFVEIENIYSLGTKILILSKNKFEILPGLLKCISNDNYSIKLSKTHSVDITYGKPIKLDLGIKDDIVCLFDDYNEIIGLGIYNNNIINPIIDIGYYFRNER